MSKFTTSLNVFIPQDGKTRTLIKPLGYAVGSGNRIIIEVPVGFVTDGASIPKVAWGVIGSPMTGRYIYAAIIHDYFYYMGTFSRLRSDIIFLEAMAVLNVPRWKRNIIYRAVRLFGFMAWNKHRNK